MNPVYNLRSLPLCGKKCIERAIALVSLNLRWVLHYSMLSLSLFLLSGCMPLSLSEAESSSGASAVNGENSTIPTPPSDAWILLSKDPVAFVPKNLPPDADFEKGHWVEAGKHGERWFVPRGGVDGYGEQQLLNEAYSMRTFAQKNKTNKETRRIMAANAPPGPSFSELMTYEMMRLHSQSTQFDQQVDQAWIDSH